LPSVAVADDLIARVRGGDRDAFRQVMQTHYNSLVRFAVPLAGESAEDVVQEVFVRVWEGRARLDPLRPIRAYLFTAVRRRVLDLHKHERAQRRLLAEIERSDNDIVLIPGEGRDMSVSGEAFEGDDRLPALAHAITALPERNRTALMLRFEQAMTHAEIGAVLGCSDKAAQQVVLRTLASLRRLLRPGDGEG
jgi:RNA polymerase sigma-70 factor (ECF subfamily)